MSAESYAQQQFDAVKTNPAFVSRVHDFGTTVDRVVVLDDRVPIGEVIGRIGRGAVIAVYDQDAPHGFALARIGEVER